MTVTTATENTLASQASGHADEVRTHEQMVSSLDELQMLLAAEEGYDVPELEFDLPPGFKLSVVIPVFNEEATIRQILSRVLAQRLPLEVIIVDDHSVDMTRDVLRQLEGHPNLRIIYKSQNEGKGAALRTGFEHATGDIVVVQDADMEYDPRDIIPLLKPILEDEVDVVYGSRYLAKGAENSSLVHRLGNGALTAASNFLTGMKLTDMETCYKVFRREVIQDFDIMQNRFGFEPEITAKIARSGYRVTERPIGYVARDFDEGKKIGIRDGLNALWCILRYGWSD